MSLSRRSLLRKTVVRGAGVCLALPWLESVSSPAFAQDAVKNKQGSARRLVFVFVPNGVHMPDWTPTQTGAAFALPKTLDSLTRHRKDLTILSGLTLDGARSHGDGPGDHARALGAFLTCTHPHKSGVHAGVSVDQVAAASLGRGLRIPSLELGIERSRTSGSCDSGYSCAYSSNLSWRGPKTPMGKEINPRRVFERLFGQRLSPAEREQRKRDRTSVLDAVRGDAKDLRARLGRADRERVDEYLTGVRELERRLDQGEPEESGEAKLMRQRLGKTLPRDPQLHLRIMGDLITLALQSGQTRVVSLMVGNAGSNRVYSNLGVRAGHHSVSHHGRDPKKIDAIKKINRFHTEQFAYLVNRLANVREGERTLLDNTAVLYGSGIGDGDRHNHDDLPILVAGKLGGAIRSGRHVRVPAETPLANLYLGLLRGVGVRRARFGDSTGTLALA